MRIIAAMLGIVDAEIRQYAELIAERAATTTPSRWAADLENIARLHRLTVEGRIALVELGSGMELRSPQR